MQYNIGEKLKIHDLKYFKNNKSFEVIHISNKEYEIYNQDGDTLAGKIIDFLGQEVIVFDLNEDSKVYNIENENGDIGLIPEWAVEIKTNFSVDEFVQEAYQIELNDDIDEDCNNCNKDEIQTCFSLSELMTEEGMKKSIENLNKISLDEYNDPILDKSNIDEIDNIVSSTDNIIKELTNEIDHIIDDNDEDNNEIDIYFNKIDTRTSKEIINENLEINNDLTKQYYSIDSLLNKNRDHFIYFYKNNKENFKYNFNTNKFYVIYENKDEEEISERLAKLLIENKDVPFQIKEVIIVDEKEITIFSNL